MFELEPLIGTSMNEAIGLDLQAARRNSPMLADLDGFPPALVVWGENETSEFKMQSQRFACLINDAGSVALVQEIESRNHFDVVLDLCDTSTTLGRAVIDLINDPRSLGAKL